MKLTIIRIESEVITCELDDGTLLNVAKRWFAEDIQQGDVIEFNATSKQRKKQGSEIYYSSCYPINLFKAEKYISAYFIIWWSIWLIIK